MLSKSIKRTMVKFYIAFTIYVYKAVKLNIAIKSVSSGTNN